jgi:pimeloyl-ACP methyl ester carboxylesterase
VTSKPHWISGNFQRDGANLHYVRTGGFKPPLVLLHGLTANGACWTPLARAFEDRFDVVMPDARGHGTSSAPPHGYSYENHAMDVIALIQHLGLDAPVVLGHSMGGMTAALVANRMTHDIRGVVLVDPTFLSPQRQRDVFESDVADQHRRVLGLDKAAVSAEIKARHPHRSCEIVEVLAQAKLQTRMSAFDVLTPPNPDYEQLVREIAVPILLIISDGGVVSLDTARRLQSLNPGLHIEQIADAGHGVPFDQPERFEGAIRSCLGWISSAG